MSDILHPSKPLSPESSLSGTALHYAKTFSSFLPSSLQLTGPASACLLHASLFRLSLSRHAPLLDVACVRYAQGVAAWHLSPLGARLLMASLSGERSLPLWGVDVGEDSLEAQRPLFAVIEGSTIGIRGTASPKPLLTLRLKGDIENADTCPRGLVVICNMKAVLYGAKDLVPLRSWDVGQAAVLAAGPRLCALSSPLDYPEIPGPSEYEDDITQSAEAAARAAMDYVAPMGPRVAGQGCIQIVDLQTGEIVHKWQAHRHRLSQCCWNEDGSLLMSCSDGRTIGVWQVGQDALSCAGRLRRGYAGSSPLLHLDARNGLVLAGSARGTTHTWKMPQTSASRLRRGDGSSEGLYCSGFSVERQRLWTLEATGIVTHWRLEERLVDSKDRSSAENNAVSIHFKPEYEISLQGLSLDHFPFGVPRAVYVPPSISEDWHANVEIRTSSQDRSRQLRSSEQFVWKNRDGDLTLSTSSNRSRSSSVNASSKGDGSSSAQKKPEVVIVKNEGKEKVVEEKGKEEAHETEDEKDAKGDPEVDGDAEESSETIERPVVAATKILRKHSIVNNHDSASAEVEVQSFETQGSSPEMEDANNVFQLDIMEEYDPDGNDAGKDEGEDEDEGEELRSSPELELEPPTEAAPEMTRVCGACQRDLTRVKFSKNQWRKQGFIRCKSCVEESGK